MPGRNYNSPNYRYGFNGKENDPETNTQDYGFRIYNPNLGKFLSVDPLTMEYPELTPYQFASNTPIYAIDLDGLEGIGLFGIQEWIVEMPVETAIEVGVESGLDIPLVPPGDIIFEPAPITPPDVHVPIPVPEKQVLEVPKSTDFGKERVAGKDNTGISSPKADPEALKEIRDKSKPKIKKAGDKKVDAAKAKDGNNKPTKTERAQAKKAKKSSKDSQYGQEKQHTSNQRPSNKPRHQKGEERKSTDKGGEKADGRRYRTQDSKKKKGS